MPMNVFFSLIQMFQTEVFAKSSPAVFPLGSTDKGEIYMTFNDINQMKIGILIFAVYALFNLLKWIIGLFTKSEQKTREAMHERLEMLEKQNNVILNSIQKLELHFAHMKDGQVTANEVREITRDEIAYVSKLRGK